jgi:methionyl-tRNA formyltransferase
MPGRLDLVFMGTPDFAATILSALIASDHHVRAVYTQPPRPAGRGQHPVPSPVQELAEGNAIAVRHPASLRGAEESDAFAALGADAAIVAAYGLLLPPPILAAPRLGCLNVHASLLPRWRGAAPIQYALLAGDPQTGITIMQMDQGLDTGPILLQRPLPIAPGTTAGRLSTALAKLGGQLALEVLDGLAAGRFAPQPQPRHGVTYAKKLDRAAGRLDWRLSAAALERQVRAFDPWPGTFFDVAGERIRVLAAAVDGEAAGEAAPGTVLDAGLAIACGDGILRLLRLQRPGRAPLDAAAFLRGFAIPSGTRLECPATAC